MFVWQPQHRRGKGRLGRRRGLGDKEKREQMLWKFLDKAVHVFLLEGIAGMTVKPQRSPALCHRLAWRKYESVSSVSKGRKKIDKHIRTQTCVQSPPHTGKTVTLC